MSKPGTKERSKSLKRDPSKVVKMNPRMIKIEQTNFWEANGFRVDVERIDDNVQQLELLNKFFTERAEIEAEYAKKLRSWGQKYEAAFAKSTMYGSHQNACAKVIDQADPLATMHDQMSKLLTNDCSARLLEWKRSAYHSKVFGGYKEHETLNKEFLKGQKSWTKMNNKVEKQKRAFHNLSAQNEKNPSEENQREVKLSEDKYVLLLDELANVAPVYVGEMKRVHQKAQNIEKRKIQFLEDILSAYVAITDLSKYQSQINQMTQVGEGAINTIHSSNDLEEWNRKVGFNSPLAVPAFEAYQPNAPVIYGENAYANGNNNNGTSAITQPENSDFGSISSRSSFSDSDSAPSVISQKSRNSTKVYAKYEYKAKDSDELDLAGGEEFEKLSEADEQEKVGNADRTEMDPQFKEMERKMDCTTKTITEILQLTREFLQPNSRKGYDSKQRPEQLEEKLGKMMRRSGLELNDSNFGGALVTIGEAMSQLADAKNQLDDSVKNPLQTLIDKDIKDVNHHRKKLNGRRLDYDYKRGKLKQNSKGMTEEEVNQSYEKLEDSIQLAGTSMHNLLSNDVEQVAQLSQFVQSLIRFHQECAESLQPVLQQLEQQQNSISSAPHAQMANITLKRDPMIVARQTSDPFDTKCDNSARNSFAPTPVAPTRTPSAAPRTPSCKALYDFEPENPGELEFQEGDIIKLTNQIDENWFEGEVNGKSGFFPINYVHVLVPL